MALTMLMMLMMLTPCGRPYGMRVLTMLIMTACDTPMVDPCGMRVLNESPGRRRTSGSRAGRWPEWSPRWPKFVGSSDRF